MVYVVDRWILGHGTWRTKMLSMRAAPGAGNLYDPPPVLKSVEAGGVGMPDLVGRDGYARKHLADLRSIAARPPQALRAQD
jgi:hypothetical protein